MPDPHWVGSALLLTLIGVLVGMTTNVFVSLLSRRARAVFRLYLLGLCLVAAVVFAVGLSWFEYATVHTSGHAELAGTILVVSFVALSVGVMSMFYDTKLFH
jgi:uncharacterized SAM-binding protein YcdF (DUF218 family)